MKVLVVNDDGINALGLKSLVKELLKFDYNIMVVAPTNEKSATSHALTTTGYLELKTYEDMFPNIPTYSVDGTPADCVRFAYFALNYDFDIVFSGVNNGLNLGYDIIYSGTVAGAEEALFFNKKGVAVSTERGELEHFERNFNTFWCEFVKTKMFKEGMIFNVNIPKEPKGYILTHQGNNPFGTIYLKNDNRYLVTGNTLYDKDKNLDTSDLNIYHSGYISVTLLTNDRTDYRLYNKYKA